MSERQLPRAEWEENDDAKHVRRETFSISAVVTDCSYRTEIQDVLLSRDQNLFRQ